MAFFDFLDNINNSLKENNRNEYYENLLEGVIIETYTSSQGIQYNICLAAFHRNGDSFTQISNKNFCDPAFGKIYKRYYYRALENEIFPSAFEQTWDSVENVKKAIELQVEQHEEIKHKKAEQEREEQRRAEWEQERAEWEQKRVQWEQKRAQWEQKRIQWEREEKQRILEALSSTKQRFNSSTFVIKDCNDTELTQIDEFILDGSNIMRMDETRGGITLCKVLAITNVLEEQGVSYKVIFDASAKHVLREIANEKESQYLIHLLNTKPDQWFEAPAKTQADDYILMLASESSKVHVISNDTYDKKNETERYAWVNAPESHARFHRGMVHNGKIYYPGLYVFTIPKAIPNI